MKKLVALFFALSSCLMVSADTAYGTLNNFDVVNDTGQTCYGFLIELDDVRSTDITYTYDWNHYGHPRITEDNSDPAHPKVFIWHEAKRNPDGSFASWTNPLDPAHPIGATSGHECTNPSVNFGCEHFGVGLYKAPSRIKYNWLIADPLKPGALAIGPAVTISAPVFVYSPPVPPPVLPNDPPAAPALVQPVIEPPEPPEPEPGQWGVPVWVKILKTVQPSGVQLKLEELVSDDLEDPDEVNWDGEEQAETEIEWTVFQKRPPDDPDQDADEIEGAANELPEGDEMVTIRYEFYVYNGPVNPEDGEAKCDDPNGCTDDFENPIPFEDVVGQYIGSQMAGFNVEAPLGLVENLQDAEVNFPYTERTVVIGGNKPYDIGITTGSLPDGLAISATGVLAGTPTATGVFNFTVDATDADGVHVSKAYTVQIYAALTIATDALPDVQEGADYLLTLNASGGLPTYFWSSGGLPAGLQISDSGVISGKPAAGAAGTYPILFTVADTIGNSVDKQLSLTITSPPPKRGDIDGDGDVDMTDYSLVIAARNKPASGPNDPRDLDKDGRITVLDARIVVTLLGK